LKECGSFNSSLFHTSFLNLSVKNTKLAYICQRYHENKSSLFFETRVVFPMLLARYLCFMP